MTTDQGQPSCTPSDLHVQADGHARITTAHALAVAGMAFAAASLLLNAGAHLAYVAA